MSLNCLSQKRGPVHVPLCNSGLPRNLSFLRFLYNTFATRWRKRSQNRVMSPTRDGIDLSLSGVPGKFITAVVLAVAAMAPAAFAQAITPRDTLVANHGSVSAGAVTFGSFQKPRILPSPLAAVMSSAISAFQPLRMPMEQFRWSSPQSTPRRDRPVLWR